MYIWLEACIIFKRKSYSDKLLLTAANSLQLLNDHKAWLTFEFEKYFRKLSIFYKQTNNPDLVCDPLVV